MAGLMLACLATPLRAAEIDPVAPLRTLPVQWNGRIAALDTVARDIVRAASGRERVPEAASNVPEDPLLTLLDLTLRTEENLDRPLIAASGLRLADRPGGEGDGTDANGNRSGLLSIRQAESLLRRFTAGTPDPRTLPSATRLAERVAVARMGYRALPIVAPDRAVSQHEANDWIDADSARTPPPITAAWERLRDAWRESGGRGQGGDPRDVMLASRHLSTLLRAHNNGRYDARRVWFEVLTNRLSLLSWSGWLYGVGAGLLLVSMLRREGIASIAAAAGRAVVGAAWLIHACGFASRWVISGRVPIQNQYESMIGLSLGVVAVAALVAGMRRPFLTRSRASATTPDPDVEPGTGRLLAFGAALTAFVVLTASHALPVPGRTIEPEAAILGTATLLKYHVTTVLLAYGFIALGAVAALVWIVSRLVGPARADLHDAAARLLRPLGHASFFALTVGILLGALWADRAWGRWWAFDPKETWALITWMVFLAATHLRAEATASRAALAILGAAVMTWSWFGVNLLIPGLHAYAGN